MRESGMRWGLGGWLVAAALAGCVEQSPGERGSQPGNGPSDAAAPVTTDPGAGEDPCPASQPTNGETCTTPVGSNGIELSCTYVIDSCVRGGNSYDQLVPFRCYMGTWMQGDALDSPCDTPEMPPPVDAAETLDAGGADADGGGDAGVDS